MRTVTFTVVVEYDHTALNLADVERGLANWIESLDEGEHTSVIRQDTVLPPRPSPMEMSLSRFD